MRSSKLKQGCLAVAQIIIITTCLSMLAGAQTPTPAPSPVPTGGGGPSFTESLKQLTNRTFDLLIIIRSQIEGPLLPWLERVSLTVAFLVMLGAFAKMWRENGGAGVDIFWWFARLAIIFAIMGNGPKIIDGMADVGRRIATGSDGTGSLFKVYTDQRTTFNISYTRFIEGTFTVRGEAVNSVPGGVLGVLLSTESSVPNPVRQLDKISMNMPLLFDSLNFSRGVMSFGDLFLTILSSFLMIALRLAAPIMIAVAIDRSLAQRVTYPYLWGAIVLTLIWPTVTYVIKTIAYIGGNIAMALGDKQQFQFDERTMQIIHSGNQNPYYTALFGALIMLIAGLSLWGAPYLAYQLSVGKVYEGVSTTVSSWVGQLVGTGVEYYTASKVAGLSRQAEVLQAEGGYTGEVTRAGAALERDNLQTRSAKILGVTGAQGGLASQLAGIEGGNLQQVMAANTETKFNKQAIAAQKELAISDQNALMNRGITETEVARAAEERTWKGHKIQSGANWLGDTIRGATRQRNKESGMKEDTLVGTVVGETVRVAGSAKGFYEEYQAIQDRGRGNTAAIKTYTGAVNENQRVYAGKMNEANDSRLGGLIQAADTGAEVASKGARRGYSIVKGGYDQAYDLNMQGNKISYKGTVEAAGQVRDASVKAAQLRESAAIINAVGHNVARAMEQGIIPRF